MNPYVIADLKAYMPAIFYTLFTMQALAAIVAALVFTSIFIVGLEFFSRVRKMAKYLLDEYDKGQKSEIFQTAFLIKGNRRHDIMRYSEIERRTASLGIEDVNTSDYIHLIFHIIRYCKNKECNDKATLAEIKRVLLLHYRRYCDICHVALQPKPKQVKANKAHLPWQTSLRHRRRKRRVTLPD